MGFGVAVGATVGRGVAVTTMVLSVGWGIAVTTMVLSVSVAAGSGVPVNTMICGSGVAVCEHAKPSKRSNARKRMTDEKFRRIFLSEK